MRDGSLAEALLMLETLCGEDPADDATHTLYAEAIQLAYQRVMHASDGLCACGSGRPHQRCCLRHERQALRRFGDREPYYRLRVQLFRYFNHPSFALARRMAMESWFGDEVEGPGGRPPTVPLEFPLEWAFSTVDLSWTGEGEGYPLALYASDPAVPAAFARRAGQWMEHGRYGLWQCSRPEATPGVWLTDQLTGIRRYVSVPPEQLQPLAPWTVLGGQLLTIDGIWRTGGAILVLTPQEAKSMGAMIRKLAQVVVEEREQAPRAELPGKRKGDVRVGDPGRGDVDMSGLVSDLVGTALPVIKDKLDEAHSRLPHLRNTDGEPLTLITARIEVAHPASLRRRMSVHPDFVQTGEAQFVWQGREMTRAQAETMIAQARAWAAERGEVLPEQTGPRRVTQAELRVEGSILVAEVNSEARLGRLVDVLEELGADPEFVSVKRTDPTELLRRSAQDPQERVPANASDSPDGDAEDESGGLCPEAMRAWAAAWLDEPVPALGGITPRDAASHPNARKELEVLLRQFEHTSARRSQRGIPPIDVAALRGELGMPAVPV